MKSPNSHDPSVTAVLNLFKRGRKLEEQIYAIRSQTYPVSELLMWENGEDSSPEADVDIRIRSEKNLGVWARFSAALNAKSDFVWMIDDDSIPGSRFLESALETFSATPGVIGSRGLKFRTSKSYTLYDEYGPLNPNPDPVKVDIVGHNWIFPREWLGVFWREYSAKFDHSLAGEDIHLSYAVQKHLGLGTYVAPHPENDLSLWGEAAPTRESSKDPVAISTSPASMRRFEEALAHYVALGFEVQSEAAQIPPSRKDLFTGSVVRRAPYAAQRLAEVLGLKKKLRP
jgi:hypothetical protein